LLALAHNAVDGIPFDSVGSTASAQVAQIVKAMNLPPEVRDYYLDGDFRYLHFGSRPDRGRFLEYLPGLPEAAQVSDWGVGTVALKSVDGYHAGHRTFHPLARVNTTRELDAYPFPDVTESWRHEGLPAQVQAAKRTGHVVVGQMSQTILETAYLLRGLEQLMVDFHERPDYVEALFEQLARRRRFQARRFAESGVDVLRIGDDIATQHGLLVGPRLYRERIKPFHAAVIAEARRVNPAIHVLYHSDGHLTPLLPDLIEIGVTAINPVQPECMDLIAVKRDFGQALTLWGCCPVQSVYAHGSRADVAQHVRLLKERLSPGGGLVVQFYNMILTPKVAENLEAFFALFEAEVARHTRQPTRL